MKVNMSVYLSNQKEVLRELVSELSKDYEYVSILGTDVYGKQYLVQRSSVGINDSIWAERGFVVRIHNGINYSEYSFNEISKEKLSLIVKQIHNKVIGDLRNLEASSIEINKYPLIKEEKVIESFYGDVEILPEELSAEDKIKRMTKLKDNSLKLSELLIDVRVAYEEVQVSKVFISTNKDLEQSYIWTQGTIAAIARREDNTKFSFDGFGGLKGAETLNEMELSYEKVVLSAVELLDAKKIEPGEYDVICSPEISGLIAHEAFGHGVEMDMFVKNRAKAVEYLNKDVASNLVTMHDGAKSAINVSSYLFDDEGTLGSDTIIIENGILKTGISDVLSALKLGNTPTGNGKRESFERKAYSRMTNTFFAKGKDKLDDMIASIKEGYLLDGTMSGMEDPKNWGIQCMILKGMEIKDGELTGNIVSPIIMTGYVPDLLKSISMVSDEIQLFGSGACGKGHKEWVKVSDGGPYIKTRARLG